MKKALIVLSLLFLGSITQAQSIKKITINDQTVPCIGVVPMECMQIQYENETDWTLFYNSIEGFSYEPGYYYELLIQEHKLPLNQVPADASSLHYRLEKVLSKIKTSNAIDNTKWVLTEVQGEIVTDNAPYIIYDKQNKVLVGNSGCNTIRIPLLQATESIWTTGFGMATFMTCDEARMHLEHRFLETIQNQQFEVKVKQNQLHLYVNGKSVLTFKKLDQDNSALHFISKNNWKLIQMNGDNSKKYNQNICIDFTSHKIYGNAGCNGFGGSFIYNPSKGTLAFGPLAQTELTCESIQIEQEFLDILQNSPLHFDVAEQTLNFYHNDKLVLMFGIDY